MIDNYIEAPKFIINMLKEQYSTREGKAGHFADTLSKALLMVTDYVFFT